MKIIKNKMNHESQDIVDHIEYSKKQNLIKILKEKNDYSLLTHLSILLNILIRKAGIRIDNRSIERLIILFSLFSVVSLIFILY